MIADNILTSDMLNAAMGELIKQLYIDRCYSWIKEFKRIRCHEQDIKYRRSVIKLLFIKGDNYGR